MADVVDLSYLLSFLSKWPDGGGIYLFLNLFRECPKGDLNGHTAASLQSWLKRWLGLLQGTVGKQKDFL